MEIFDNKDFKIYRSHNYNMIFRKRDGFTARWGKTKDEDPQYCECGPELMDIEISAMIKQEEIGQYVGNENIEVVRGKCYGCPVCYKFNNTGEFMAHMTLTGFKKIVRKLPKTCCQIAFGILRANSNPHMFDIFDECRKNDIVPNVTINDDELDEDTFNKLVSKCGAIAVSVSFGNRSKKYNLIEALSNLHSQINIHFVLSEESPQDAIALIDDVAQDKRLSKLNALVFLTLKPKGAAAHTYTIPSANTFNSVISYAQNKGIRFGMDSCCANKFLRLIKENKQDELEKYVEPCESFCYSGYCNFAGIVFPCSFVENEEDWQKGINLYTNDFGQVWNHVRANEWRSKLLANNRSCPIFQLD